MNIKKFFCYMLLGCFTATAFTACQTKSNTPSAQETLQEETARRLLIVYTQPEDKTQIEAQAKACGGTLHQDYASLKIVSFDFKSAKAADKAIPKLQAVAGVKSVEKDGVVSIQQGEEMTMTVASETRIGHGVGPQTCLLVKYNPTDQWQYMYSSIQGFDYQEGYEYTLKIRREERANPPQDASKYTYHLIEILSKEKKQSEGLPK